jgi:hypothetical protein
MDNHQANLVPYLLNNGEVYDSFFYIRLPFDPDHHFFFRVFNIFIS